MFASVSKLCKCGRAQSAEGVSVSEGRGTGERGYRAVEGELKQDKVSVIWRASSKRFVSRYV